MSLSISNLTRKDLPFSRSLLDLKRLKKITTQILGGKFELSIVIAGDKRMKNLNIKYRNKNYVPNVLSFELSKDSGEIFINLGRVKKEALKFEMTEFEFFIFLIIHGCLHLKGIDHGQEMENLEEKFLKKYFYTEKK